MGYNAMWKKINKHTEKIKMEPYNSPVSINKELNYRSMYSEVLAENQQLLEEMREYKTLQVAIEMNQSQCENTFTECERFAEVLLHHYQKLKQSETDEKKRKGEWDCEREQLRHVINLLSVQMQEKDYNIQSLTTQNEELQEQLKQGEITRGELRMELALREERVQELTEEIELIETKRSSIAQELETVENKTVNLIKQSNEQLEQYMDKVVFLHTDINNILHRCKIQASKIVAPVCTGDGQIEAMKESVNQLDEVASAATSCIIRQEELKELTKENEQLRDELEDMWRKYKQEEAKVKTLNINNRYYKALKQNLESEVNKYADDKTNKIRYARFLEDKISVLKNDMDANRDQITALEKDKLALQENLDKARKSLESHLLQQDKENLLLPQLNEELQFLESMIDKVKTTLRIIIPEIDNCNSLKILLNELENPNQVSWNQAVS